MAEDYRAGELTQDLRRMSAGDRDAESRVYELVLGRLRSRARNLLRFQGAEPELQVTELVQETYLRLSADHATTWQDRRHFFCIAARAMRSVAIDHWRHHNRVKRSAPGRREELDADAIASPLTADQHLSIDFGELNEAVEQLGKIDPRAQRVVELHLFLEQPLKQVAETMHVSLSTVGRDWQFARSWLSQELQR